MYIICFDYCGVGGFLVGMSGKVMLMFSGGIDSLVVGYLVMKCGLEIEVVYFYSLFFISECFK